MYSFEGLRSRVERTINHSLKDGTHDAVAAWRDPYANYTRTKTETIRIQVATLGQFPEIVPPQERMQAPVVTPGVTVINGVRWYVLPEPPYGATAEVYRDAKAAGAQLVAYPDATTNPTNPPSSWSVYTLEKFGEIFRIAIAMQQVAEETARREGEKHAIAEPPEPPESPDDVPPPAPPAPTTNGDEPF